MVGEGAGVGVFVAVAEGTGVGAIVSEGIGSGTVVSVRVAEDSSIPIGATAVCVPGLAIAAGKHPDSTQIASVIKIRAFTL